MIITPEWIQQQFSAVWGRLNLISDSNGQLKSKGSGVNQLTLDADAALLLDVTSGVLGLDTQTANRVFAGPTTGAADEPTFRALVAADLPAGSIVSNVKNLIPPPMGAVTAALTTVLLPSAAATGFAGMVRLDGPMLLHSISYAVTAAAVGAGQVVRVALYTEAGVLVAGTNATDAVGTNTGVRTIVLGADVQLNSGNYYAFICSQTDGAVTNCTIDTWTADTTFDSVVTILVGTVVVAAGAAPSPLGTVTQTANRTPYLKLTGT